MSAPDGAEVSSALPALPDALLRLNDARDELTRFMSSYDFAIQEVETKVRILQQEFARMHRYNPIEHISSRLKSPESVVAKARRRGVGASLGDIRREIHDIAGVRIVCSFTDDVYQVQRMLCSQDDVELLHLKDYIAQPKESGYRSLHAIVRIPVFLSSETVSVPVELQFRTIAQDFWASLEHKILYKYEFDVPDHLRAGLQDAASTAASLDAEMARLSTELQELADHQPAVSDSAVRDFLTFLAPPVEPPADAHASGDLPVVPPPDGGASGSAGR